MLLFCRIIPLFFLLLIPCIFFGQDDDANLLFIDELSSNNVANAENLPLRILEIPKGSIDLKTVQPKDPEVLEPELFSKGSGFRPGTYISVPAEDELGIKMEVVLITPDSKITLESGARYFFSMTSDNNSEHLCNTCKIDDKNDMSVSEQKKLSKKYSERNTNHVNTYGSNRGEKHQLAKRATKFTISQNDSLFRVDLFNGEIAINNRIGLEFPSDSKIDSLKRLLYITETKILTDSSFYEINTNIDDTRILETNEEIDSFFKVEIKKQKKILRRGPISRNAYKLLEKGDTLGISEYQTAMDSGEITRDQFIQSSLILIEFNLRKKVDKNQSIWLDASIYFNESEHDYNELNYRYFNKLKMLREGYGNDLAASKEYFAWAYTLKLLINGCLETSDQNPSVLRRQALRLRDSLYKPD